MNRLAGELIAQDCILAISRSAADLITRIEIAQRYRYSFGGKESLDRHRAAVSRAQQAVDDLQLALLAVAVVAALRQFAAAPPST